VPPLSFFLGLLPTYQAVNLLKSAIAAGGFALLLWSWWLVRRGRPQAWRRTRDTLLGALALAAFAGWFNFGLFHYRTFVHHHEFFHYFLGSKYFDEVGYTRLYRCVAVADLHDGRAAAVKARWVRDLETNVAVEGATLLLDATKCTAAFTPERWQAFRDDVRWFREHVNDEKWRELAMDHGYNASPLWTLVGGWLANLGPASDKLVGALASVDVVLIVAMWGCVCWAFGWRALCVAMVWWGTNYPARYTWTGGAFLRTDWLVLLVLAICLARRGRTVASGAILGLSSALRLFPLIAASGVAVGAVADCWTKRSWFPIKRLAALSLGFVISLGVVLALTAVSTGGVKTWGAFAANSRKHAATPLGNHVGLPALIAFEEQTRAVHIRSLWLDSPWDTWRTARQRVFASREPLYWMLLVLFVATLTVACRRLEPWAALTLGVGLIPMVGNLTSYYFSMLLVFAFLWPRYAAVGIGLLGLSAITNVSAAILDEFDDVFGAISLAVVIFVWFSAAVVALSDRRARQDTLVVQGTSAAVTVS
jgi:hypothetical protein